MAEAATLEMKIPEGFVQSTTLFSVTKKGLLYSETVKMLTGKLGVRYKVDRAGRIVNITHSDSLRLARSLSLSLISNREFLSWREELRNGRNSLYSWLSDVYDFESDREAINVYLNPVSYDLRKIFLDANEEPINPIRIVRAQARAIRNGYRKYIRSYDENGIPTDFADNGNHTGDKFWSSPVGIKAALHGWKEYARTGVEEFLSLRDPIGRNNDGMKIAVYAKIPKS